MYLEQKKRGETIVEQFYSARQQKDEDSMSWSCRLEEIYRKAVIKGVATQADANEKLRSKFWNGLHQWIKYITGYKFDALTNFDELRKEIRLVEKEHVTNRAQSNMGVISSETDKQDEIKDLKGMIQQLTTRVSAIEQGRMYKRFEQQPTNWDHKDQQQQSRRGNYQSRNSYGSYSRSPRYHQGYYRQYEYGYGDRETKLQETENGVPICYRCKQPGHLARRCTVRMDHSRRSLNIRSGTDDR